MEILNEIQEDNSKQLLEDSLEIIANQIQLIEHRYHKIINNGILKETEEHQQRMRKIKTMVNMMKINKRINYKI